ncbi:MAG: chromate transporter [Bacilli bacterium]|nr:chromate transporter [Bacilli bacterium]
MKNRLLDLFLTFLKIGATTFGGGYAMIPLIRHDVVEKKKWLEEDELIEILAIAESTPGPIAINVATYTGYRIKGFFGSLLATLAIVLPSFFIIFAVSLLYNFVRDNQIIVAAFMGIKAAVALLILSAGFRLFKKMKKSWYSIIVMIFAIGALIIFDLFAISFSSIFLILSGALLGFIFFFTIPVLVNKKKGEGK